MLRKPALRIAQPLATMGEKMNSEENQIYLRKIDEIREKVYEFYNMSNREDLIMVYEMKEDRIYSYIYDEFKKSLNEKSRKILVNQYQEAKESNQIVLFIKDELRRKLKSFTI